MKLYLGFLVGVLILSGVIKSISISRQTLEDDLRKLEELTENESTYEDILRPMEEETTTPLSTSTPTESLFQEPIIEEATTNFVTETEPIIIDTTTSEAITTTTTTEEIIESEQINEFSTDTTPLEFQESANITNCTLNDGSLNCASQETGQKVECDVVSRLSNLHNDTLAVSSLIIEPELVESVESLKLLMKLPADRFSIVNASLKAYTIIGHHLNHTRETTSFYSERNLTSPGVFVKDPECFSQIVSLVKSILVEQFRIFIYLNHAATLT